nr:AtaL-like protein [uncultured Aquabacterium sp.]
MRFEHLIEINSPRVNLQTVVPPFTRAQLWRGLLIRVRSPERFPMGPDRCECLEVEPGVFKRTLHFGQHVMRDEVQAEHEARLVFTPESHGDTAPIRLTLSIEEPQAAQTVLRFVYEALGDQTTEESYYNDYRHSAWLHHDRDMVRTLRQWLVEGGL